MQSPTWARALERNLFGGLLGVLAAALGARLLVLIVPLPGIVLVMMSMFGAAAGMFIAHYGSKSAESVAASFELWNDWIRRFSLKVMLWMLGLAAAIGVLTVLTASYDTLGRLAGTVIATSITAGLLWPMSALADRKDTQAAGILGMSATLLVYLMVVPLIWDLDTRNEEMVISSLVIGLTTPAGMLFLGLKNHSAAWLAARVGIGVYVVVLACFLIATWHQSGYQRASNWWMTGWTSGLYGSLAFACLTGLRAIQLSWRWIGVGVAASTWILVLIEIWSGMDADERLFIVLTSIPIVLGHMSLAMLAKLTAGQRWLRVGTVAAMIIGAVFFDLEVISESSYGRYRIGLLGRIAGAGGIVAACGSLALLICARLNGPGQPRMTWSDVKSLASVQVTCPRCGQGQRLALGGAPCSNCGLVMQIEVSLPFDGSSEPPEPPESPESPESPFR